MKRISTGSIGTTPITCCPTIKAGVEAYTVIREALAETGRIALGRVVMHTRERLVALEPRDKGIIAYTLRMGDEVIQPKDAFDDIPAARPNKQMIEIARKIIEQQEGAFEPEKFEDRYESALRDLIRRKEKGEKLVTAEPVEEDNVIDLMEAPEEKPQVQGPQRPFHEAARPQLIIRGFLVAMGLWAAAHAHPPGARCWSAMSR